MDSLFHRRTGCLSHPERAGHRLESPLVVFQIEAVLAKSRDLYQLIGDCGDEYRR
jgi:hypothetical protein